MKRKLISQREARALRHRVLVLEARESERLEAWVQNYPGGTHIARTNVLDVTAARIHTARLLGHAVVVTDDGGTLNFYALPVAEEPKA
ncbi:hypothetical protein [Luteibacter yeojuensis]|uniref:Uncharacterized protein n=1 Tax=Luteibacter yeojuensis TaxID=345309 RepID=A0A7X5QTH2_9GAMM|nr:hypothetical protein [Luteibacter yeojuensis]NID15015.1 hypothetical protein [Luteibacter yeojuensis]